MSKCYASKLIEVAEKEVGYLEKETNKNLDSKTANAGDNNYTKYARDFDNVYTSFYNGKKNGYAWCDVFVDWCFIKAFGVEDAKRLLGQPNKSYGAGCACSARYYKQINCFNDKPIVGAQIFFTDSKGEVCHTGIVYKIDTNYVYTIEGNTSAASGVVANGGAVAKKKYKLTYSRIYGYGIPKFDKETTTTKITTTATNNSKPTTYKTLIKEWQKAAIADGYKLPSGADGIWGNECVAVAKKAICKKPKIKGLYSNKNLTKFLQKQLGFKGNDVDGKFWNDTYKAVVEYQKKKQLTVDGIVGYNTWKKILGIK